jgi:hypothetical protein
MASDPQMPPLVPKRRYTRPKPKNREHYRTIHQKLRKELLAKNPLYAYQFEGCSGWATEADHIRYPARSIEDYTPTCAHCHKMRHRH